MKKRVFGIGIGVAFFVLIGGSIFQHYKEIVREMDQDNPLAEQQDRFMDIDDKLCEISHYGDHLEKLTENQKVFYYIQELDMEINCGGFDQYFFNSSGDNAIETIDALKTIGAKETAKMVQDAIDVFDGKYTNNRGKRQDIMEQIEDKSEEKWNQLDENFCDYPENWYDLMDEFIKKHKDEFEF